MTQPRISLSLCACGIIVLMALTPLWAQSKKKKVAPVSDIDLDGVWTSSEGMRVRIQQVKNIIKVNFISATDSNNSNTPQSNGLCASGSDRSFYVSGSFSSGGKGKNPGSRSFKIDDKTKIQLCTEPALWKDCHGKGLNPDTDVWETTCTGEFEATGRVVTQITLHYKGQLWERVRDKKTDKITSCKQTGTPQGDIVLTQGIQPLQDTGSGPDFGRRSDPSDPAAPKPPPATKPVTKAPIQGDIDNIQNTLINSILDPHHLRH